MKKKLTQQSLFQSLETHLAQIPDNRHQSYTKYTLFEAISSAFSAFFLQAPSLRSHVKNCLHKIGKKNLTSLFGIRKTPTDTHIRNLIDQIDTGHLEEVQDDIISKMQRSTLLEDFKTQDEEGNALGVLLGIDGFEYFRSSCIECDRCCTVCHKDGKKEHFHRVILGGLIHPKENIFLPICQEFIVKQDGSKKEDCERVAAKRWIKKFRRKHPQMQVTLLGDDAFCTEPYIKCAIENRCNYIFSVQPGSHKTLYDWIEGLRKTKKIKSFDSTYRKGSKKYIEHYEYANNVPIKDGERALRVNFCMVTIKDAKTNDTVGIHSFVTGFTITEKNCRTLVSTGRRRWKSENEGNNTLTNNGYHAKHNFGHGKKNLSHNFFMLNLIAFMIHTILAYVKQEGFAKAREVFKTIRDCFERIRGVFFLITSSSWENFYAHIVDGIDSS